MQNLSYTKSAMTFLLLGFALAMSTTSCSGQTLDNCKEAVLKTGLANIHRAVVYDAKKKRCQLLIVSKTKIVRLYKNKYNHLSQQVSKYVPFADIPNSEKYEMGYRCAIIAGTAEELSKLKFISNSGKGLLFQVSGGTSEHNYTYCTSAWKSWCKRRGERYDSKELC